MPTRTHIRVHTHRDTNVAKRVWSMGLGNSSTGETSVQPWLGIADLRRLSRVQSEWVLAQLPLTWPLRDFFWVLHIPEVWQLFQAALATFFVLPHSRLSGWIFSRIPYQLLEACRDRPCYAMDTPKSV